MRKIPTYEEFVFEKQEIIKMSVAQLEKEFKSLNKRYLKIDQEMDLLAKNNEDTWNLEQELDKIQTRMSEISGELENRN
jgi:uncharacterized protein (DUF3084 family)